MMHAQKTLTQQFEFYLADLDNLILVESDEEGVVIRTTRNNLTERRKASFIRHLAAEGHIPDSFQWYCDSLGGYRGVKWVVDNTWLTISPRLRRRSNRFMGRLFLWGSVLWLLMMSWFAHSNGPPVPPRGPAATFLTHR